MTLDHGYNRQVWYSDTNYTTHPFQEYSNLNLKIKYSNKTRHLPCLVLWVIHITVLLLIENYQS